MSRIRHLAITLAVLAPLALAITSATPAAAATGQVCTFNGNHYCLDANFVYGNTITADSGGRTICGPSAGTTGVLRFCGTNAPPNMCVQAYSANTYNLQVGRCTGVSGISWSNVDNGDGSRYLINQHYSGRHLAGDNVNGDIMIALPLGGPYYYKMQPIS